MGSTSTQLHDGASLSSGSRSWKFDVFLSFRGSDTCKGFVDHLSSALLQKGIFMFKDDVTLERDEDIPMTLLKAIEESRFAIVIFSENYASSKWCLEELAKILQCKERGGLTVLSVFYKVDPSDFRKLTGTVREAFARHEGDSSEEKVQTWRNALMKAPDFPWWDSEKGTIDGFEAKLVEEIVKFLQSKLDKDSSIFDYGDYYVGLDTRVADVKSLLGIGLDDLRIVGIHGMGGIGKTTVAKAVYDKIHDQFEASSYLKNVRDAHKEEHLRFLQELLISDIFSDKDINIKNVDRGRSTIMRRVQHKRVLVVFDDLDDEENVKKLIGKLGCFGLGSRIIILTRYPHLLEILGVTHKYDVKELEYKEALELFCHGVFGKNQPTPGFEGLTNSFLRHAGGVPLVLKVLVRILRGLSINEWQSQFDRLRNQSNGEIHPVLKLSYESLKEEEDKDIFLDIACFNWKSKDFVIEILDACGFKALIGIRNLERKALVKISDNRIDMHDLIREMGRHIVYEKHRKEPGRRSRLWKYEDVYDVLTQKEGTKEVEAIVMDYCGTKKMFLSPDAFSNMSNLRLLSLQGVQLLDGVDNLSKKLRLLEWPQYPLKFLPANFQPNNLAILKMPHSRLKQPWNGRMCLDKLKSVDLSDSLNIIKISNFMRVTNLKELILDGCMHLVKIDPSIEAIKRLTILNLGGCKYLEFLPTGNWLKSIEQLCLSGCSKLKNVSEVLEFTECLIELYLDETCVKELPVKHWSNLQVIFLRDCKELTSLPSGICGLKRLAYLILSGCSKLSELPEHIGELESLVEFWADSTAIKQLPSSIMGLKKLQLLSLEDCGGRITSTPRNSLLSPCPFQGQDPMGLDLPPLSGLSSLEKLNLQYCTLLQGGLPNDLGSLSSLRFLYLCHSNITSLPESIRGLEKLTFLNLSDCKMLETLLNLPTNIDTLEASGCTLLETLPNPLPRKLTIVDLTNCHSLEKNPSLPIELLRNRQKVIKSALEDDDDDDDGYPECTIFLPGRKIPKHFSSQNIEGPCLRMQLMPNWHKNLKGFVACVVFEAKATSEAFSPSLSDDLWGGEHVHVECYGMWNDVVYATDVVFSFERRIQSDHLLLDYMALDQICPKVGVNDWKTWTDIIFYVRYSPEMFASVKTTSVHMAYENDEEWPNPNPNTSIQQSDRVEFWLIEWIRGVVLRKRRPHTIGYGFDHKAGGAEPLDIIYGGSRGRFFSELDGYPHSFYGGDIECGSGRGWAREGPGCRW